ncbi:hypothetical protein ASO20_01155 [Mycoplasma sp. (ex Biomphalaria glabrata)]|uniref:potassium channel family protein n=1 Tax=Mycoplasma sp. (ex Biomphalaria glabrata) TaxID=1749074 RepID=UPI00073A6C4E|nr:TrkA family potassium uptake protein [Mycoplasma sp. (ex Biomphalaria glabrata)]ALV23266.1 hypothetical protein ASO20_01155 [Mycoplasma sp. (ex Biomphalaria glabrata)]
MTNDYCVIGLGKFGRGVLETLLLLKRNVIAIDLDKNKINEIAKKTRFAIALDATNYDALNETGVDTVHTVIVAVNDIESSILTCVNLKELGIKNIIAKAISDNHEKILRSVGVTQVVRPEIEIARQLAKRFVYGIDNKLDEFESEFTLIKLNLLNSRLEGKKIKDLNIRDQYNANIVYIKHKNKIMFPNPDSVLELGDGITCVVNNENARDLKNYIESLKK